MEEDDIYDNFRKIKYKVTIKEIDTSNVIKTVSIVDTQFA
jgi:hypothetical protein